MTLKDLYNDHPEWHDLQLFCDCGDYYKSLTENDLYLIPNHSIADEEGEPTISLCVGG